MGSREDLMYDVLRTDILDLKLRPGLVFSIKDVCDAYGTGRTPVREALIRLSKEGLITFLPQKGTMVSKIDFQRADNERFLRSCVEEQVMLEFMALNDHDRASEAAAALKASLDRQERALAYLARQKEFPVNGPAHRKGSGRLRQEEPTRTSGPILKILMRQKGRIRQTGSVLTRRAVW